ncbi:MAG: flagellar hook assembly protein FlgD [Nitrospirota bacterium]
MDISTIGSVSNSAASIISGKTLGKQDFLNLLLKQLSYQDPLNPMDSTEFTTQLSQFSSLEELTNINSTLSDVLAFQQSMQNASVANMIGKTVKVDGNSANLSDTAEMNYELGGDAAAVEISIYDGAGRLVRTENAGAGSAGSRSYIWDGKDSLGNTLPKGAYTFQVEAMDISGNQVPVQSISSGIVTEVIFEKGMTYLMLDNGTKINLSDIKSIG